MKERTTSRIIPGFDILKLCLALIIVNIHANLKIYAEDTAFYNVWSYFNSIAVPAFFVLSSYFFFRKLKVLKNANGGGYLWHYEKRLLKLYCFWIIVLSPAILLGWHKEYLQLSWHTLYLFVRNFFLAYQFGASWFFGALIVGVPIVYGFTKIMNDRWIWVLPFIIYVYVFMKTDNKTLFDWYEANIRTPELSFPAGLLWITIGHLLSSNYPARWLSTTPLWVSILALAISFSLGCVFYDYDYLFRIPSVLSVVFIAYQIHIDNILLCKRFRTYSIHFFCMHYSLIWALNHFFIFRDNKIILYISTLLICWAASEIIIHLKEHNGWHWLRFSM